MPTDDTEREQPLRHPETGVVLGSLGEATVTIDVDEETYRHLIDEYHNLVAHDYTAPLDVFVYNHCDLTFQVTVDGVPVDELEDNSDDSPPRHEPADFGGGESTGVQDL